MTLSLLNLLFCRKNHLVFLLPHRFRQLCIQKLQHPRTLNRIDQPYFPLAIKLVHICLHPAQHRRLQQLRRRRPHLIIHRQTHPHQLPQLIRIPLRNLIVVTHNDFTVQRWKVPRLEWMRQRAHLVYQAPCRPYVTF